MGSSVQSIWTRGRGSYVCMCSLNHRGGSFSLGGRRWKGFQEEWNWEGVGASLHYRPYIVLSNSELKSISLET